MKQRTLFVAVAVLSSLAGIVVAGLMLPPSVTPVTPPPDAAAPIAELNVQLAAPAPADGDGAVPAAPFDGERAVGVPVQHFPPPSIDLTGPKLGTQRVAAMDGVGDVFQLYFDAPAYLLYMAVVEPSGLRTVWRLDQFGRAERVFAANLLPGEIRIFGTSTGTIFVQITNPSMMFRTDDGFASWDVVLEGFGLFWAIADDGNGTVYGTQHESNSAALFRSADDGRTWERWKDFQRIFPDDATTYAEGDPRFRLRHLHDVIFSEKADAIIVGTGDVARYTVESRDGGETWQRIWDEGFTSHAVVSGGNRYLLGPDKLRGRGIALYDAWNGTLEEVWDPAAYGYAGYVYSMLNVDGIYYAATHTEANEVADVVPKFGVVVSPDAHEWYPFLEWGPLGNHARTDVWLAAAPATIYASVNGVLYEFRPLDKQWFAGKTPFGG